MGNWRADASDNFLYPILHIIADNTDPAFSQLEFVGWFEEGVTSFSMRVYDAARKKLRIKLTDPINKHDNEIRDLLISLRAVFIDKGESWVAMKCVLRSDGHFDLDFDYNDPYKFDFRK